MGMKLEIRLMLWAGNSIVYFLGLLTALRTYQNFIYTLGSIIFSLASYNLANLNYYKVSKKRSFNARVDINDLLSRARENEKKQKKENLVFFGIVASVIVITGIIASL